MSSIQAARERLSELDAQMRAKQAAHEAGDISNKQFSGFISRAEAEATELSQTIKTYEHANRFMAGNDIRGFDEPGFSPQTKGFGPRPRSPLEVTHEQLKALHHASQNGTPFRVEIGQKHLESAFMGDVETKATAPVAETGTGGVNLPSIMMPTRAMGLPYEPTRFAACLQGAMMTGPSAAYLEHTGNTNEATGVAELGTKTDLGPTIKEKIIKPQKIAGLISVSWEASMDYQDFAAWLPTELQRSVINAESNYLLNAGVSGGPSGAAFTGILAASGTLTRAVDTTNSEKPLDTLSKAFVDLRTGSAYADPDLIVMSPATWGALRREKDDSGRYILDLLAGPAGLTWDGSTALQAEVARSVPAQGATNPHGGIWGVPVVETTQIADGKAVVLSRRAGAAIFWQRTGMVLEFNPWGTDQWTKNYMSWRCEERISLSIPRPAAINIVTGLPTGAAA